MNKKILISLSVISVVAAIAVGGTIAYFSNTETSAGNIFVAGAIDLKIDHTKQTYNEVDCKTCSVGIQSDTSDIVTGTASGTDPVAFPHAAVLVSLPYNVRWTAEIPGVSWIWATDPTTEYDAANDVIYTFEKTFEWWGPITGATLQLNVGADNSYEVYLNGNLVGGDNTEYNYEAPTDVYSGTEISPYILQGDNTLEIQVKNWAMQGGTWQKNPGGLLYKLVIDGQCEQSDYFRTHCQLWGLKDLENEKFFNFNDVKPGDRGINVISLHNYNNNGWVCMSVTEKVDNENAINQSEEVAGDITPALGELSNYLKLFVWRDENGNGIYEPATENAIGSYVLDTINMLAIYDSTTGTGALIGSTTKSLGLAWCFGNQIIGGTGTITCDGSGAEVNGYNKAQTDSFLASLVFYTEQSRNNGSFVCVPRQE
jgi:predicted ribosomally synthesized peptide with SipW-like signal peptide